MLFVIFRDELDIVSGLLFQKMNFSAAKNHFHVHFPLSRLFLFPAHIAVKYLCAGGEEKARKINELTTVKREEDKKDNWIGR